VEAVAKKLARPQRARRGEQLLDGAAQAGADAERHGDHQQRGDPKLGQVSRDGAVRRPPGPAADSGDGDEGHEPGGQRPSEFGADGADAGHGIVLGGGKAARAPEMERPNPPFLTSGVRPPNLTLFSLPPAWRPPSPRAARGARAGARQKRDGNSGAGGEIES